MDMQQDAFLPFDAEHLDHAFEPDWDAASLLPPGVDADVAAIARWTAAYEALENSTTAPDDVVVEEHHDDDMCGPTDSASACSSDSSVPHERERDLVERPQRKRGKSDDAPRARRIRKPRKSTYAAQKEEKCALTDEIRLLEARLELLKVRAGVPTGEDKRTLASLQSSNFQIVETIHGNLLSISKFHSLISRYMHSMTAGPMNTTIHLPRDRDERRATLRAMRDMKLRRAQELLENRVQYVDNTKPYATEERFFTDDGVYHCKRFEILPFPEVDDVTPVFDALLLFLGNMGPTLRRKPALGAPTLHEDMEMVEPAIWHRRIVGPIDGRQAQRLAYEQELQTIGFARLYTEASPYGIVAADSVDFDELYPYNRTERVRKDVTAAISVRSEPRTDDPTKRIVVVRRNTFLLLHPAPFVLPKTIEEDMRTHISDWCHALNASLTETIATATKAG